MSADDTALIRESHYVPIPTSMHIPMIDQISSSLSIAVCYEIAIKHIWLVNVWWGMNSNCCLRSNAITIH